MAFSISQKLWVGGAVLWLSAARVHAADEIELNFPEPVSLQVLIDYVSKSLNLNIIYDPPLVAATVTIRSPASIPVSSLLPFLQGLLKSKQLALIEDVSPGWLRVVKAENLHRATKELRSEDQVPDPTNANVITQIVPLKSADIQRVIQVITPFLSADKSSVIPLAEERILIITDYESSIARVLGVLALVDQEPTVMKVELLDVQHRDAAKVASLVTEAIAQTLRLDGKKENASYSIQGFSEDKTILLIGPETLLQEARRFATMFDQPLPYSDTTKRYSPRYVTVERIARLVDELLISRGPASKQAIKPRVVVDADVNAIYVTAPQSFQEEVQKLLGEIDVLQAEPSRPLRLYQPKNRKAKELMDALSAFLAGARRRDARTSDLFTAIEVDSRAVQSNRGVSLTASAPTAHPTSRPVGESRMIAYDIHGQPLTLAVDEATNTILVVASPDVHRQITILLESLDVRRMQVMIETTLVAVSLDRDLSLGFEFQTLDLGDAVDYQLFTSFGLSQTDPVTGARTLVPGIGVNGIILTPDEVPVILRALATRSNSRIISAPKIVVMDNAEGSLSSIDEAPFTSVNASDTVATTSFGGFESAGTELSVKPHVIDASHLTLEYELTFSNFTGASASGNVPPPRTSNTFSSSVEIPSSHTIVVGGLTIERKTDSFSEVPFLGRVPGIGMLFQSNQITRSKIRVYAFIRPTILQDDEFTDLKFVTRRSLQEADFQSKDFPPSVPLLMK